MTGSRHPRRRALAWAFYAVAIGVGATLAGIAKIAGDPAEDPELRALAASTLLQLEKRWREKRIR